MVVILAFFISTKTPYGDWNILERRKANEQKKTCALKTKSDTTCQIQAAIKKKGGTKECKAPQKNILSAYFNTKLPMQRSVRYANIGLSSFDSCRHF